MIDVIVRKTKKYLFKIQVYKNEFTFKNNFITLCCSLCANLRDFPYKAQCTYLQLFQLQLTIFHFICKTFRRVVQRTAVCISMKKGQITIIYLGVRCFRWEVWREVVNINNIKYCSVKSVLKLVAQLDKLMISRCLSCSKDNKSCVLLFHYLSTSK